jgi:hypothetical protein
VGGGPPIVKRAGVGEGEGTGADRHQTGTALGGVADSRERFFGRGREECRVAGENDRVGPRQRLDPGLRRHREARGGGDGIAVERAGRELIQRLTTRSRRQRKGLGGSGEVEGDQPRKT